MTELKVGDRVRSTDPDDDNAHGVITGMTGSGYVRVLWDEDESFPRSHSTWCNPVSLVKA